MMHGHERSDPVVVAENRANADGRPSVEGGKPRACPWLEQGTGAKGNTSQTGHGRNPEPGKRVPRAGACTDSREAEQRGAVHRAAPPCRRRCSNAHPYRDKHARCRCGQFLHTLFRPGDQNRLVRFDSAIHGSCCGRKRAWRSLSGNELLQALDSNGGRSRLTEPVGESQL
jgi:hypothetical protein